MRKNFTPEDLRIAIEQHFKSINMAVELYSSGVGSSGGIVQIVSLRGKLNSYTIENISISINGQSKPIITSFQGILPIIELVKILNEINSALETI